MFALGGRAGDRLGTLAGLGAVVLTGVFGPASAFSQELLWRRAIGGSIDGYPAQGPSGEVYIVAEDRALHSLNPLTGEQNWIYRPGGRLRNLLLVAPDGTIYVQNDRRELYAVTPGGTGRWKMDMKAEPAALPAASPDGRLVLALAGGRVVCTSRRGVILWSRDEGAEASAGPVIGADGIVWLPLTDGRILALDPWGRDVTSFSFGSAVSVLALDGVGRIWAGGFNGRVVVLEMPGTRPEGERTVPEIAFDARPGSSRVAALLTDGSGNGSVFLADGRVVDYDAAGAVIAERRVAVSGGAPSAAFDGTLYVPAADGSIRVVRSEAGEPNGDDAGSGGAAPIKEADELRGRSVLAEPLLTEEGVLIAGGGDWILYAWDAGAPGDGWRQFRGGPRRSGAVSAVTPRMGREEARRDPGFFYRELMAVSDDADERMDLVRELEGYPDGFTMRRDLPWADLLMEDLVSVGTVRKVDRGSEPMQSHSAVRARGYALLAAGEDYRSRELILACLAFEEDEAALAAGFRALGRIGVDWDGASMRLMADRYRRVLPAGDRLAVETARAFSDLVRYNGRLSDPAAYSLMDDLLRSELSASARAEVYAAVRAASGF